MAFSFAKLPIEIQRQCIRSLDIETLKCVRLASRFFAAMATEALFHTVNLLPTDESAGRFTHVLEDENLNRCVRKVLLNTSLDPNSRPYCDGSEMGDEKDAALDSWAEAVGKIHQFPRTKEVELKFACECAAPQIDMQGWEDTKDVSETMEFRTDVLQIFFRALNDAINIDTLTINNLQDVTNTMIYESEDFAAVQKRIKKLPLQIATEYDDAAPESSVDLVGRHTFFKEHLLTYWLVPMSNHLTDLSLYCDDFWGVYPFCDTRGLHFPNLKSLALGNWSIAHEWQIDWINSHGETLEELILDDCPIVHAARMTVEQYEDRWPNRQGGTEPGQGPGGERFLFPSMRWESIFSLFRQKLVMLKRFAMGHGLWDCQEAFERRYELPARLDAGRYCVFDTGTGPSPWIECDDRRGYDDLESSWEENGLEKYVDMLQYPDPEKKEQGALDELLFAVAQR